MWLWHFLANMLRLTVKELRSIKADPIMLVLIGFVFTFVIPIVSDAISTEIKDVAVAIVDDDQSQLSARLAQAIQPPLFLPAQQIGIDQVNDALNRGKFVLVLIIPPAFEADLASALFPELQILVDATAVAHAGNSAAYLQQILSQEVALWLNGDGSNINALADVVFRTKFNPNTDPLWFSSITQLMNNITILTMILAGAALIRERERGTVEHLLVMPLSPHQIVISKIAANGLVVIVGAALCLFVVIRGFMGVPVSGSLPLFFAGTAIYTVSVASLGILLATNSASMAQFGLLAIPVIVVLMLLSGGFTPLESMPSWVLRLDQVISPAPHFVSFAQAVLYREAGLRHVWPELGLLLLQGAIYYIFAMALFRRMLLR
mgnify:CR=1 FL=1